MQKGTEVIVYDTIPISQNKEIEVEVKKLSRAYWIDKKFKKSTKYAQGIRKWKLRMAPQQKIEITYDVIISFDKKLRIRGIR